MLFFARNFQRERRRDFDEKWFAWHPVRVHEGWVWLETVRRKRYATWEEWRYDRIPEKENDAATPV